MYVLCVYTEGVVCGVCRGGGKGWYVVCAVEERGGVCGGGGKGWCMWRWRNGEVHGGCVVEERSTFRTV